VRWVIDVPEGRYGFNSLGLIEAHRRSDVLQHDSVRRSATTAGIPCERSHRRASKLLFVNPAIVTSAKRNKIDQTIDTRIVLERHHDLDRAVMLRDSLGERP